MINGFRFTKFDYFFEFFLTIFEVSSLKEAGGSSDSWLKPKTELPKATLTILSWYKSMDCSAWNINSLIHYMQPFMLVTIHIEKNSFETIYEHKLDNYLVSKFVFKYNINLGEYFNTVCVCYCGLTLVSM